MLSHFKPPLLLHHYMTSQKKFTKLLILIVNAKPIIECYCIKISSRCRNSCLPNRNKVWQKQRTEIIKNRQVSNSQFNFKEVISLWGQFTYLAKNILIFRYSLVPRLLWIPSCTFLPNPPDFFTENFASKICGKTVFWFKDGDGYSCSLH